MKYPPSGPMAPTLASLKYVDFSQDQAEQETWIGKQFNELLAKMEPHLPANIVEKTKSKACLLS